MDRRKHFVMTFSALFFLGLIVAKPGSTFYPPKEKVECKYLKGNTINVGCDFQNKHKGENPEITYHY